MEHMHNILLGCTRFTTKTWNENMNYRSSHLSENSIIQPIYGLDKMIAEEYTSYPFIFIFEMNNTTNKIEGIGLIENRTCHDKEYKIYDNSNYNLYIYSGKYWMDRETLLIYNTTLINDFELMLFKGKSHLKRLSGITILNEDKCKKRNINLNETKIQIFNYFKHMIAALNDVPKKLI